MLLNFLKVLPLWSYLNKNKCDHLPKCKTNTVINVGPWPPEVCYKLCYWEVSEKSHKQLTLKTQQQSEIHCLQSRVQCFSTVVLLITEQNETIQCLDLNALKEKHLMQYHDPRVLIAFLVDVTLVHFCTQRTMAAVRIFIGWESHFQFTNNCFVILFFL